jgi:hypothetical protein
MNVRYFYAASEWKSCGYALLKRTLITLDRTPRGSTILPRMAGGEG